MYIYADNAAEISAWLEAIRTAVPKGVPVTTAEEIATSWGTGGVTQVVGASGTAQVKRVTVFQNTSNSRTGKVIALPGTMAQLLKAAGDAYGITGKREYNYTSTIAMYREQGWWWFWLTRLAATSAATVGCPCSRCPHPWMCPRWFPGMFTATGGEIEDMTLIRDDDILYVSAGEEFTFADESMAMSPALGKP